MLVNETTTKMILYSSQSFPQSNKPLVTWNMRNMCMCVRTYLFQFRIETNKV